MQFARSRARFCAVVVGALVVCGLVSAAVSSSLPGLSAAAAKPRTQWSGTRQNAPRATATGSPLVDGFSTGLLVFDSTAGKYAGPIRRIGASATHGEIALISADRWAAYQCGFAGYLTCKRPQGEVRLAVGSSSEPALRVTEGYNEYDSAKPVISCQVQAASGLKPTCATTQVTQPGCLDPPNPKGPNGSFLDSNTIGAGYCYQPIAVDRWFISAPGICDVSGVTCSSPAAGEQQRKPNGTFDGNQWVYALTGVFVFDTSAHEFAGPIARIADHVDWGDLHCQKGCGGPDADKWTARRCIPILDGLCKKPFRWPRGSVTLKVGIFTPGIPGKTPPTQTPLDITAIYNEQDQKKPRVECKLFINANLNAHCYAHQTTEGLWVWSESSKSTKKPYWYAYSKDTWFITAPGICQVRDIRCSAIPSLYFTNFNHFPPVATPPPPRVTG